MHENAVKCEVVAGNRCSICQSQFDEGGVCAGAERHQLGKFYKRRPIGPARQQKLPLVTIPPWEELY